MTKILIIDDERSVAVILARLLRDRGISVELAAEIEEGLRRARSGDFEVVLSDFYLGDRTALELIARLRTLNAHLPVIIMTAMHTADTAIEAIKHGAYDYFAKPGPFDFEVRSDDAWPLALAR